MPKGRHAAERVRRPLTRPVVAAAVGGAVLVLPLGVAAWQSVGSSEGTLQPIVADAAASAPDSGAATDARAFAALFDARERAQASRGTTRPAIAPSAEPSAAAPEPEESSSATAVAEQPAPEAAPEPPPVPAVVGQLWATTDVNVRSGPSSDTERIGNLAAVTQVDVTGATENGWTQVVVDGRAGWVNSSYLSEAKPEPAAQPEPQPAGVSNASCPISASIESNLTSNARAVYRAVCAQFGGSVSSFGGYRPGDGGDHGSGRAVDIMVSGQIGWDIARYVQANAGALGVTYVIYEQRIWMAGNPASAWEWMEDRGSATANHYDHVHVSVR